jgi:hypothetical protein
MNISVSRLLSLSALCFTYAHALPSSAELIYALAEVNHVQFVITFDSADPGNLISSKFLGTSDSDSILGIDVNVANGNVIGINTRGGNGYRYRIDPITGGVTNFPFNTPPHAIDLNGASYGVDIDPTTGRIRVVSDVNQNAVAGIGVAVPTVYGTNLFYGVGDVNVGKDPNIVDIAYSNNVSGALTTQLYGIDSGLDILVAQAGNAGTLTTIGALGVNVVSMGGFDISPLGGLAYAALLPAGSSQSSLYSIDLATGAATPLGVIGGGLFISAMTVSLPEPATNFLVITAACAILTLRKRCGA